MIVQHSNNKLILILYILLYYYRFFAPKTTIIPVCVRVRKYRRRRDVFHVLYRVTAAALCDNSKKAVTILIYRRRRRCSFHLVKIKTNKNTARKKYDIQFPTWRGRQAQMQGWALTN